MKRKLALMALAAAMVFSNAAPYTVMTAHAEESDEIGDILDDVFGGNKPDNSQGTGTTGGGTDEIDWDNMNKPQNSNDGGSDNSSSDNSDSNDNGGSSDNSGSNDNGGNSGNSGSSDNDDEIGDILDDIFGGNKPDNSGGSGTTGGGTDNIDWDNMNKPQNGGSDNSGSNTGNSGNSGSSNNGGSNTGSNAGSTDSSTTVTDPATGETTTTTVNADGSTTVVTTDPATGETTSVIAPPAASSIAVDVTDPAILAVMPEAMVVISHTSGIPFVHALDATRTSYNVWSDGYLVDAFYITDATGAFVPMQAVDIIPSADGKVYVNVTIDPAVVGATVQAAEEQRVSFAKLYGIDGVMINGMLVDTFVALAS